MFHKTCENIIQKAVDNKIVQNSLKQEYIYGLELSIAALINYSTIVIIGVIMHMTVEAAVFLIIYTTMRRYIGGFHFNSQIICYLSNFVMCPVVLVAIKYLGYNQSIYCTIVCVSLILLWILAPIPAEHKSIDMTEERVYRCISHIMIIAVSIIFITCMRFNTYAAKLIMVSILMVTLFAVAGILNLKMKGISKPQGQ